MSQSCLRRLTASEKAWRVGMTIICFCRDCNTPTLFAIFERGMW